MKTYRFKAEILEGRGGGAYIEFPYDVRQELGTGSRVAVRATFDGEDYRGSLAPMGGGCHIVGIRKEIRTRLGKAIGDSVSVTITRDTEERVVEIPSELAAWFRRNKKAKIRFDRLGYTHRREHAEWVGSAKQEETRLRRAEKAIEKILGE